MTGMPPAVKRMITGPIVKVAVKELYLEWGSMTCSVIIEISKMMPKAIWTTTNPNVV